jgi:hypothetical protein
MRRRRRRRSQTNRRTTRITTNLSARARQTMTVIRKRNTKASGLIISCENVASPSRDGARTWIDVMRCDAIW